MLTVKWNPVSEIVSQVLSPPKPARMYQPDWYKKIKGFHGGVPDFNEEGMHNGTLKHCVPFFDAMNAGYILESWQEIRFDVLESGEIKYYYPTEPQIITHRNNQSIDMGLDYHPVEFTLIPPWQPELPNGWSMLYTQPLNRPELPFFFVGGIVDSDIFKTTRPNSNLPFYLKKSFSGTIPIGTPLVQMIPIKREDWVGKGQVFDEAKHRKENFKIDRVFWGGYKKFAWSKKSYK